MGVFLFLFFSEHVLDSCSCCLPFYLPGLGYLCCLSRQPPAGRDDDMGH